MTVELPNGLVLHGYCVQCAMECSISLDDVPEDGAIMYIAECDQHGRDGNVVEELDELPADIAKQVRRETKLRRRHTVCCFEMPV